jgi:hypothetical protein
LVASETTMTTDEPTRMTMLRTPVLAAQSADDAPRDDRSSDDSELDSAARLRRVVHEAVAAVRAAHETRAARDLG